MFFICLLYVIYIDKKEKSSIFGMFMFSIAGKTNPKQQKLINIIETRGGKMRTKQDTPVGDVDDGERHKQICIVGGSDTYLTQKTVKPFLLSSLSPIVRDKWIVNCDKQNRLLSLRKYRIHEDLQKNNDDKNKKKKQKNPSKSKRKNTSKTSGKKRKREDNDDDTLNSPPTKKQRRSERLRRTPKHKRTTTTSSSPRHHVIAKKKPNKHRKKKEGMFYIVIYIAFKCYLYIIYTTFITW